MTGVVGGACRAAVEGFVGTQSNEKRRDAYVDFFSAVLAFLFALVILGFIGKWLWNSVVVDLFAFAKPARSFWQIVGLMVFLSLVSP
jgi:hypothetical protein